MTLNVALNNDTSLATFQVNGQDVQDGDSVDLDPLTDSVDVTVETTDPDATYEVTGDTDLVAGENTLAVTVTAADGETSDEYDVTLNVALNNDTSLATFQVNGQDVQDGDSVDLAAYTTSVDVVVLTTDANATFEIVGDSDLMNGENTLTVTVTAADGETTQDYNVTLNVLMSSDTSLTSFQVNGTDIQGGDTVRLAGGTDAVDVGVQTTDANATYAVVGDSGLVAGENTLTVTVTAADGETTQDYTVTLLVLSSDASITGISVEGISAADGDIVTVPADTTSVSVEVTTTSENATYTVEGADVLQPGENTVTITVTAEDGTTQDYSITVRVGGLSADTGLNVFKINGTDVVDGSTVQAPARTTSVSVVVETRDASATFKIVGRNGLVVGNNNVVVTVTAPDHQTVKTYTVTVVVAPISSNTNLSVFTVNGIAVSNDNLNGVALDLPAFTRNVTVAAQTEDVEATSVVSGKTGLVDGINTLRVVVTAANGTMRTYEVRLNVRVLSSDSSLRTLTFNGQNVVNNVFTTAPVAQSVSVSAIANDSRSTVVVSGNTGLRAGDNIVSVAVTAENGSSTVYKVTVKVPANNDTSLKSLIVNGSDALSTLTAGPLAKGTKTATVLVATNDPLAKFTVAGASNLVAGPNLINISVTAADGVTVTNYQVATYVTLPSSDKSLKTFKINGSSVSNGSTLVVPALTQNVSVEAAATDPASTVVVSGKTGLVEGVNVVSVLVTAEDGSSSTYTAYVKVLSLSSDNSLKTLQVNGSAYTVGQTVDVAYGTSSVSVNAEARDVTATVAVSSTALKTGLNTVTVKVTAANGAVATYAITVRVAKSSNKDVTSITVNGQNAIWSYIPERSVVLPVRTAVAAVKIVTADPEATAVVSNTALVSGPNTVNVTITAADGSVRQFPIYVTVTPLSSNTDLSAFQVDGSAVSNGATVNVANRTVSVPVVALAADSDATVAVSGNSSLKTGNNIVSVVVTAANGTKKTYSVTVVVAKSSNKELQSLTVNGLDATGGSVTLPSRTSVAVVKAVTADADATVAVSGANLVSGLNTVSVTVTAADGSSRVVNIAVTVTPLSSDKSLKTFKINNVDYVANSTVQLGFGATSVAVQAVANDSGAKVDVTGSSPLVGGLNTVTVTVTAANGDVGIYTAQVNVPVRSSNANISTVAGTWTINGVDVSNESTVVELPAGVTAVSAAAKTADSKATLVITGATGLSTGENTVTFKVVAEDGVTTNSYTRTVRVKALSSNTKLTSLTVAGQSVEDNATVNVANRTVSVPVVALAADSDATVAVSGNSSLKTGNNIVSVVVTAANGTKKTYSVTVVVAKSSNKELQSLTVNGLDATGGSVTLPSRTSVAVVKAVTADADATVAVSGANLVSGLNTVSVTVTAADGSSRVVNIAVTVTPLSSDKSLKTFKINNVDYVANSTVQLGFGATSVAVQAVANDSGAKVDVTGSSPLVGGLNTVTVTVTAANGDVGIYTAQVNVPVRSSNANISTVAGTWTINGVDVSNESTVVELPAGVTAVSAAAKTADSKATLVITGATGLTTGDNAVAFKVVAEDGVTTNTFNRTVRVKALSSNTKLTSLTVAGQSVDDGATVNVEYGTTRVSVAPVLDSAESSVTVSGNTGLVTGINTVSVVVTAPSGASKTYSVTVNVAKLVSNTDLKVFTVNGNAVVDGSTVNVDAGTKRLKVSAIAADATASVAVTGKAVSDGVNTLTVVVTATSGDSTTYTVTVNVGN